MLGTVINDKGAVKDYSGSCLATPMSCSELHHFLSHVELGRLCVLLHLLSSLRKAFLLARSSLPIAALVAVATATRTYCGSSTNDSGRPSSLRNNGNCVCVSEDMNKIRK